LTFPTVIGTTIGTPVKTLTQLRASIIPPLPVQVYLQDPVLPPGLVELGLVGAEVADVTEVADLADVADVTAVADVTTGTEVAEVAEGAEVAAVLQSLVVGLLSSTGAAEIVAARAAMTEMRAENCMLEMIVLSWRQLTVL